MVVEFSAGMRMGVIASLVPDHLRNVSVRKTIQDCGLIILNEIAQVIDLDILKISSSHI